MQKSPCIDCQEREKSEDAYCAKQESCPAIDCFHQSSQKTWTFGPGKCQLCGAETDDMFCHVCVNNAEIRIKERKENAPYAMRFGLAPNQTGERPKIRTRKQRVFSRTYYLSPGKHCHRDHNCEYCDAVIKIGELHVARDTGGGKGNSKCVRKYACISCAEADRSRHVKIYSRNGYLNKINDRVLEYECKAGDVWRRDG